MRMRRSSRDRSVLFAVVDGVLEQVVLFTDGHTYTHRCARKLFEVIAYAVEEQGIAGFSLEQLVKQEDLPSSQADVALAFLKERGYVEVRRRHCYAAPGFKFEDAMIAFYCLEEVPG